MSSRLRILMLTSSYPLYPGDATAPFIEELAAGIAALGHEAHVLLPAHSRLRRAPVERGVRLHVFRYAPPTRFLQVWGYAGALEGDVGLRRPAYAVAPLALGASTVVLGRLAGRLRPDLLVAHWVIPNGPPAALVARARRLPLAVSLHGSDVYLAAGQPMFGAVARWAFGTAGLVTACSSDLASRAMPLGATAGMTRVIPYGVDNSAFRPIGPREREEIRAELGVAATETLLLAGGRLVHKKGLDVAIEALALLARQRNMAHCRLVLFGDGDLRADLEQLVVQRGLQDRVLMVGRWDRARLPNLFAASDMFLLPSVRDFAGNVDGLPNTLLEAMASGLAIVASNVAGVPSVVDDGQEGLLVRPGDAAALASGIATLLDHAPLAAELGRNALQRVERELTWPHVAARFVAAYQALVAASGQSAGRPASHR